MGTPNYHRDGTNIDKPMVTNIALPLNVTNPSKGTLIDMELKNTQFRETSFLRLNYFHWDHYKSDILQLD